VPPTWWVVRYVHTSGTAAQRTEEWRARLRPDGRPLDLRHIVPDSAPRSSADSATLRRIALASLAREAIDTSTLQESEVKETARPARRDATVAYTDTTVKLPAGATARTWVQLAGDEPLVARRGVELPEEFLRADRARQTNRALIAGLCILLLLGVLVTGAFVVKRRRPIVVDDGAIDRSSTLILIGVLVVLATLGNLNSLPSQLFRYDTAEPWSTFVGTTALGFVVVIPVALFVFGLWLVLGAMRRRVGIPMRARGLSGSARNDMLIAGLGLGGLLYAVTQLDALVPRGGIPRTPETVLNEVSPLFAGITDIPQDVMLGVALVGIPILVVAGLTQRWSLRALIAAAILALLGAFAWSTAPVADVDPVKVVLLIAGVAVVSMAIATWGAVSAWSWIIGALAYQALNGLRDAAYGPVWQARGSGALTFLVASALTALIARRSGYLYANSFTWRSPR
jgi:hypothetical protein